MLMKLTPVVNFINILRAAFVPIFFQQKIKGQSAIREQLQRALSVQKGACKVVMKLTPVLQKECEEI